MTEPTISRRRFLAAGAGSAFTSLLATLPGCGGGSKRDTGPGSTRWETDFYTTPFGYGESGLVYVWHDAYDTYKKDYNVVTAIDNATGSTVWSADKAVPLAQVGLAVSRGIANSTVFLSTKDRDGRQTIYGLDGKTGVVRWQNEPLNTDRNKTMNAVSHLGHDLLLSAYQKVDSTVEVCAYRGTTGEILWRRNDFKEVPALVSGDSFALDGVSRTLIFSRNDSLGTALLQIINPETGETLNRQALGNANLTALSTLGFLAGVTDGFHFYQADNLPQYSNATQAIVYVRAYDFSAGQQAWEQPLGGGLDWNNRYGGPFPTIGANGLVFAISAASDVFKDPATIRLDGLNAITGAIRWTTKLRGFSSACVAAGHGVSAGLVFCLTSQYQNDTLLYACDVETGVIRWTRRYPYYILEPPYVAPDGSLYIKPNGLIAVRLT